MTIRAWPRFGFWPIALALALAGCATTPTDVRRWAATGDDAASRIEPQLYSPNPAVRQAALEALLKMPKSHAAIEALGSATISPNPVIRGDAGAALVLNPNRDLDFDAITLVADPDPAVRRRVAQGLADAGRAGPLLNTQRAGVYLWGLTQDENAEVRAAAAEGLGSLGLSDPIDFALEALRHDPEPRVRAAAARGLGSLARAYLAGERGPDWRDAQVEQFLSRLPGGRAPTPTQARGEEIVAALCEAARTDAGQYTEVNFERIWFQSRRVEETHWVAIAAAAALDVPGHLPRAEVAAAQAAARARLPVMLAPVRKIQHLHNFVGAGI